MTKPTAAELATGLLVLYAAAHDYYNHRSPHNHVRVQQYRELEDALYAAKRLLEDGALPVDDRQLPGLYEQAIAAGAAEWTNRLADPDAGQSIPGYAQVARSMFLSGASWAVRWLLGRE